MQNVVTNILGLDIGERRIGVAVANSLARLPRPLITLTNDQTIWEQLDRIINEENVGAIVVGLPRNLSGEETAQTKTIRDFALELGTYIDLPLHFQDEALTSRQAETELDDRGKGYDKSAIDALAATYILDDFLNSHNMSEVYDV